MPLNSMNTLSVMVESEVERVDSAAYADWGRKKELGAKRVARSGVEAREVKKLRRVGLLLLTPSSLK